jgi:hypothetical protein
VLNLSGVAENNVTIGTGSITAYHTYTGPTSVNLGIRIMSSSGSTNKASDFQVRIPFIPVEYYSKS